jgi:hypothetical protein
VTERQSHEQSPLARARPAAHVSRKEILEAASGAGSKTSTHAQNTVQAQKPAIDRTRAVLKVTVSTTRKKKTLLCQHQFTQEDRPKQQSQNSNVVERDDAPRRKAEKPDISAIIEERVTARLRRIDEKAKGIARPAANILHERHTDDAQDLDSSSMALEFLDDAVLDQTNHNIEQPDDVMYKELSKTRKTGKDVATNLNSPEQLEPESHMHINNRLPEALPRSKIPDPKQESSEPAYHIAKSLARSPTPRRDELDSLHSSAAPVEPDNHTTEPIVHDRHAHPALPVQGHVEPLHPRTPKLPIDEGPWSRDAFDLFVWRPPNWDEDKWSVKPAVS